MPELTNSQIKNIVVGVALISIITVSSFTVLFNSNFFDFGKESGIFAIVSSPDSVDNDMFYEGEPITLEADCYKVESGKIVSQSLNDVNFEKELIFTWSFKQIGWEEFILLKEGLSLSEITLSSLKPEKYVFRVETKGQSIDYKILNPLDYLTVSSELLLSGKTGFNEVNIKINPLVESITWITNPKNLAEFCIGEEITFTSHSKRNFNLTRYSEIANKQVEAVNDANYFLKSEEIKTLIQSQLPSDVSVNDIINDQDFIPPYGEDLILSAYSTYYWYDEWVDSEGIHHPKVYIGEGSVLRTATLDEGYHTITFVVRDSEIESSASDKTNLWISPKKQPGVPILIEFLFSIEVDNSVFVDWDSSKSNNPEGYIDHYELQLAKHQNEFHSGLVEPYVEGIDYISITGNYSYFIYDDLPSSVNSLTYEDGKHWFRVRAVDHYGIPSYWSNVEGVVIDKAPSNIYCEGIFYDNGTRVDQHNPDYQSTKGFTRLLKNNNQNDALYNYSLLSKPSSVYDFYQGQFEDEEANYYYQDLNLTTNILYQYQNFHISLKAKNIDHNVDPETNNQDLTYLLYSSLDGLIYQGEGFTSANNVISYQDDIAPYLCVIRQDNYVPLSRGIHTITVVVCDPSYVGYQLVSMLLEFREICPYWESDSLSNIGSLYLDPTGDGNSDWGIFGLTWEYPQFNPYMPSYYEDQTSDWERKFDKIKYFEIEVTHQYGETEYSTFITQRSPQNWHYWEDVEGEHEDYMSPYELTTGNWSFRIRAVDRDYCISNWSEPCKMVDNDDIPLISPYDIKYPILLNEDNPPPNPVITANGYRMDNSEVTVRVNEPIALESYNSTDLNGDQLYYTWFLDGILLTNISGFDPHASSVSIYPEWIGQDINPFKLETSLLDGDDYGDWGIHTITLQVNDGVTVVNTSFYINIIPVNSEPTISSITIENIRKSDLNENFLFDYETIRIFPTDLTHFDNQHEIQDVHVLIEIIDVTTNDTAFTYQIIIESQIFNSSGTILSENIIHDIFNIEAILPVGDFKIFLSISDGIVSNIYTTNLKIIEKYAPYDFTIIPYDEFGNSLPQNNSGYYIYPNQEIIFQLSWKDDQQDEKITLDLVDNLDGLIFHGISTRVINTENNGFYFVTSGEHHISAVIKDPYGSFCSTNLTCFILLVMILPVSNENVVENSIEQNRNHPDYWNQDRSIEDVPELMFSIGDGQPSSPSKYISSDHVNLSPITYSGAQWLRIWFQMQTRINTNDILIFKDVNDNICWKIRIIGDYTKSPYEATYEYQDDEGNWYVLPKLALTDSFDKVTSINTNYEIHYSNRLVSIIIPGNTVKIEWVTAESQGLISDLQLSLNLFYGFKIAYVEYLGSNTPEIKNPCDIDINSMQIQLIDSPTFMNNIVLTAWRKIVEFANENGISHFYKLEFSLKLNDYFSFKITISYNALIHELRIEGILSFSTGGIPLLIGELKFKANGMFRIAYLIFPFSVKEFIFSIDFAVVFGFDLIDLLYPIFPPIIEPIQRTKLLLEKAKITAFPDFLELKLGVQLRGGLKQDGGWWIRFGIFGEIALKWNIIKLDDEENPIFKISFNLLIYWKYSELEGLVSGARTKFTIEITVSLGSLIGKKLIWDIVFFEWKLVIKKQLVEIPLGGAES